MDFLLYRKIQLIMIINIQGVMTILPELHYSDIGN